MTLVNIVSLSSSIRVLEENTTWKFNSSTVSSKFVSNDNHHHHIVAWKVFFFISKVADLQTRRQPTEQHFSKETIRIIYLTNNGLIIIVLLSNVYLYNLSFHWHFCNDPLLWPFIFFLGYILYHNIPNSNFLTRTTKKIYCTFNLVHNLSECR